MEGAPPRRLPLSWSDIPVELAGLVLGRLAAHVDRVRFAAVCPQWRAAARQGGLAPPMPLLLLPDATVYSLPGSEPFRFTDCAGYSNACGIGNWLVFSGEDGFFLRDPFSKASVTLPALSRIRVQYVGQDLLNQDDDVEFDEIKKLEPRKIMFCSPDLIAAIGFTSENTWIAVCRPGATSWWSVRAGDGSWFDDIVFYQGKLYGLDYVNRLCAVDISVDHSTGDPCVSQIQQVMGSLQLTTDVSLEALNMDVAYLVESRGALLVVCRRRRIDILFIPGNPNIVEYVAEQVGFEVFEANFGQARWVKVTTLGGDQVLFLRRRCCRSICVSSDEVPGDCIYFMENDYELVNPFTKAASSSCSVYSMRDNKISTTLPTVSWMRGKVFATWLFPQN